MPRQLTREARDLAIEQLQQMIMGGMDDHAAQRAIASQWDVGRRTARRWLAVAYHRWRRHSEPDRPHHLARHLARVGHVLDRAAAGQDWTVYLRALAHEARVLGLEAPQRMEHLVMHVDELIVDIAGMIKEEVPSIPARKRLLNRLRHRAEQALSAKPELLPSAARARIELASARQVDVEVISPPDRHADGWELGGEAQHRG